MKVEEKDGIPARCWAVSIILCNGSGYNEAEKHVWSRREDGRMSVPCIVGTSGSRKNPLRRGKEVAEQENNQLNTVHVHLARKHGVEKYLFIAAIDPRIDRGVASNLMKVNKASLSLSL